MVTLIQLTDNIKPEMMNEPVEFVTKNNNMVIATTHGKTVQIKNLNSSQGWVPNTPVKVDCTCDDFKYRRAYVLWKHGALLYPENYLLEPPKKTNPGMVVSGCKHITRVAQEILESTQGANK